MSAAGPEISREILHPGKFYDLEIDDVSIFYYPDRDLGSPEIFEPHLIPLNVTALLPWYNEVFGVAPEQMQPNAAPGRIDFQPSGNYRQVEIGRLSFALSVAQARVVRRLHEAWLKGDPWVPARVLLAASNSESEKLAQLFRWHKDPHWSELIKPNGEGLYRLNID